MPVSKYSDLLTFFSIRIRLKLNLTIFVQSYAEWSISLEITGRVDKT